FTRWAVPMIRAAGGAKFQKSRAMTLQTARAAIKAATLKSYDRLASFVFLVCTLLMLASVFRMWSHWFEIAAMLGFDRAAGVLVAITSAAVLVSWWVNTGND